MNNLPVLIVGAGPSGLMMACLLATYGINFRIIDEKPIPCAESNAIWIQTRTLEIFDQINILDRFISLGHSCDGINFYENGKSISQLSLQAIDSIYSYVLMLPQHHTESILSNYLEEYHDVIERSTELVNISSNDNSITCTLKHPDGQIENVLVDWVIACDGANSTVRDQCHYDFIGEDLKEQFIVADATINFSYLPKNEIHYFFDNQTVFAAFPLGDNRYRIAANLNLTYPRKIFTEREIIEIVQERAHGNYYVTDVAWISLFWVHGKVIENMQCQRIFFVGDSAHIHSPAGGQGMNTGIQDAYNLAWKIALVIQKLADPSLLDTYHIERYPVINEVVQQNEYYTKLVLIDNQLIDKLKTFNKTIQSDPLLKRKICDHLTQLDICYNSQIIQSDNHLDLIKPGLRAPNIAIDNTTLYQYFKNTKHTVLLFTGISSTEKTLNNALEIQHFLEKNYKQTINSFIVSKHQQLIGHSMISDSNGKLHDLYKVREYAAYIIRPDTHIAYCSENFNLDEIHHFLKKYLVS